MRGYYTLRLWRKNSPCIVRVVLTMEKNVLVVSVLLPIVTSSKSAG
jgi:hypothetical protein